MRRTPYYRAPEPIDENKKQKTPRHVIDTSARFPCTHLAFVLLAACFYFSSSHSPHCAAWLLSLRVRDFCLLLGSAFNPPHYATFEFSLGAKGEISRFSKKYQSSAYARALIIHTIQDKLLTYDIISYGLSWKGASILELIKFDTISFAMELCLLEQLKLGPSAKSDTAVLCRELLSLRTRLYVSTSGRKDTITMSKRQYVFLSHDSKRQV